MGMHGLYGGRDWSVDHDRRAKVAGAELRYADLGEGEPVLTIHGTHIADAVIVPLRLHPPLFERHRFISYYRAGYNGSTLEKPAVTVEESADHVVQLLDHLGIEKAHVVGYSLGGVIAFQLMLSHPERVHAAVLLEPYLPREGAAAIQANIDAYMKAMALYQAGRKVEAALSYMESISGPRFLSSVQMTGPLDVWRRVEESVTTAFEVDLPAAVGWGFRTSRADEMVAAKPTMPVLAVMGLDSEAALPGFRETQEFLTSWLPQAERAGIPFATHGLQSMNPVAVGEAILSFLDRHPMR